MNSTEEDFLTVKKISEILHVSYDVALLLVKTEIPHLKVGKGYRVRTLVFRKWFKNKEKTSLELNKNL